MSENSLHRLLNISQNEEHLIISTSNLPTYRHVLSCLLANIKQKNYQLLSAPRPILKTCIKKVVEQVNIIYAKNHVPTFQDKNIYKKICKFYKKEYCTLKKVKPNQRCSQHAQFRTFKDKLGMIISFWAKDAVEKMEKSREEKSIKESYETYKAIEFLKDVGERKLKEEKHSEITNQKTFFNQQLTPHPQYFIMNTRSHKLTVKNGLLLNSDQNEIKNKENDSEDIFDPEEYENIDLKVANENVNDNNYQPHTRNLKTGTTIFIPHDILNSRIVQSAAIRNNISPVGLVSIVESLIESCNGDKSSINLHYSTAYR